MGWKKSKPCSTQAKTPEGDIRISAGVCVDVIYRFLKLAVIIVFSFFLFRHFSKYSSKIEFATLPKLLNIFIGKICKSYTLELKLLLKNKKISIIK